MDSIETCLRDSNHIWRFQKFFGVEKLDQVEYKPGGAWVAAEVKQNPQVVVDGPKGSLGLHDSSTVATGGCSYKKRSKDSQSDEEETSNVNSSGYSSEGEEEVGEGEGGCIAKKQFSDKEDKNIIYYKVQNRFWYFLFLLGSQLGDEPFCALFFSFWFWNLDASIGRRLVLVWNLVMYIGQGLKDIIRWPRPTMPPVIQLEQKWSQEYGMPSTHAMIGLSLPTSAVILTMAKYDFPVVLGVSTVIIWCSLVCCSRMYLGMHSLADILAGLVLSACLLVVVLPLAHYGDTFLMQSPLAPSITITLSLLAVWLYPGSDRWTPARGDTTAALGCYLGVHLGQWLNYQLGIMLSASNITVYLIHAPSCQQLVLMFLRVVIGGLVAGLTRAVAKPLTYQLACVLLDTDKETLSRQEYHIDNKQKLAADLFYKFLTWMAVCFTVVFLSPLVFRLAGCDRQGFYTELSF